MSWLKDIWTEARRKSERDHPMRVSAFVLGAARSMSERIQDGLDHNIEGHLVLTRRMDDHFWQLIIDFSEDSCERVFGQNISNDLKRILGDKRQHPRIPEILDAYSRFGMRR